MKAITLASVFCLLLFACGKGGHAPHGPSQYGEMIKECELTYQLLTNYISQGQSDLARAAASSLKEAAKKLSGTAKTEIPQKMSGEVETKAKNLIQACEEVIRATQGNQQEKIVQAQSKIKPLLGELKEYAQHAAAPHKDH